MLVKNDNHKKMFLLISHSLNENQKQQAREIFEVQSFVSLPEQLQEKWSNIPPEPAKIDDYLHDICIFLRDNSQEGDIVLVQGDYGATYSMVNFCKQSGLIPVYATTKRVVREEIKDGRTIVQRIFEHVRFREY